MNAGDSAIVELITGLIGHHPTCTSVKDGFGFSARSTRPRMSILILIVIVIEDLQR